MATLRSGPKWPQVIQKKNVTKKKIVIEKKNVITKKNTLLEKKSLTRKLDFGSTEEQVKKKSLVEQEYLD